MNAKQDAAKQAARAVKDGMKLGLGTGSTVAYFVEEVAKLVREGMRLTCVSTSEQTSEQAKSLGIEMVSLNEIDHLDLIVDGADEVDPLRRGIKGGGGALFREKMVALTADHCIWIVDAQKCVKELGAFGLPVEIVPFGYVHTMRRMQEAGLTGTLRQRDGKVFVTDNGNYIVDVKPDIGFDPEAVEKTLRQIVGVVETGLFLGICDEVMVGRDDE